ncbi:MAG: hypothetical protein KJ749_11940 [Planctomycetes bacterium]|nr:hypothetical protein [Planctomycetota bacterium]
MATSVQTLQRRIDRIKQELNALGDLRPGHLSEQYNVCGNPGCRCKADPPQRHGPYLQLGWTRKGKSTTRFIRKPDEVIVREQLQNHEQLQTLVNQWIDAAIELCDLKLKQSRAASKASKQI